MHIERDIVNNRVDGFNYLINKAVFIYFFLLLFFSYYDFGGMFSFSLLGYVQRVSFPLVLVLFVYNRKLFLKSISLLLCVFVPAFIFRDFRSVFQDFYFMFLLVLVVSYVRTESFGLFLNQYKNALWLLFLSIILFSYIYTSYNFGYVYDSAGRISSGLNPNAYAFSLIFLCLGLCFVYENRVVFILIFSLFFSVLMSGSRGGLVVFIIAVVFLFIAKSVDSKNKMKGVFFLFFVISLSSVFYEFLPERILSAFDDGLYEGTLGFRYIVWSNVWSDFLSSSLQNILLGKDFVALISSFYQMDLSFRGDSSFDHYRIFHNDLLRGLVFYGVFGSAVIVLFFLYLSNVFFGFKGKGYLLFLVMVFLPFLYENSVSEVGLSLNLALGFFIGMYSKYGVRDANS